MFKDNNWIARTKYEVCSKLTIKTSEVSKVNPKVGRAKDKFISIPLNFQSIFVCKAKHMMALKYYCPFSFFFTSLQNLFYFSWTFCLIPFKVSLLRLSICIYFLSLLFLLPQRNFYTSFHHFIHSLLSFLLLLFTIFLLQLLFLFSFSNCFTSLRHFITVRDHDFHFLLAFLAGITGLCYLNWLNLLN